MESFGFQIFVGDVISGVDLGHFRPRLLVLNRKSQLFESSLYWNVGYNLSLYSLWLAPSNSCSKVMAKKTKFWQKLKLDFLLPVDTFSPQLFYSKELTNFQAKQCNRIMKCQWNSQDTKCWYI